VLIPGDCADGSSEADIESDRQDTNTCGGSQAMHDTIQVGNLIRVSEPKNHFPLATGAMTFGDSNAVSIIAAIFKAIAGLLIVTTLRKMLATSPFDLRMFHESLRHPLYRAWPP
jgi:hypothetical protein